MHRLNSALDERKGRFRKRDNQRKNISKLRKDTCFDVPSDEGGANMRISCYLCKDAYSLRVAGSPQKKSRIRKFTVNS